MEDVSNESSHGDVDELPAYVCWKLLRSVEVGRLAVVLDGRPEIFPVNHLVDHGTIVFRTAEGTKLAGAIGSPAVAFEVDGYEPEWGTAWSVVVKGGVEEIVRHEELLESFGLPLFPWHAGPKPRFVRIVPDAVTGRRFTVSH